MIPMSASSPDREDIAASPNQARLNAIRNRVASSSPVWEVVAAERVSMTAGESGELPEVLTFAERVFIDDLELILHARDDLVWLLHRYDRAVSKLRSLPSCDRSEKTEAHGYAKACAIMCKKFDFRQFLSAEYGLEAVDDERVNTKVRFILNVQSRAELDTDIGARERWFSLCDQFRGWKTKGGTSCL